MTTGATEAIARWFDSDEMRPHLEALVQAWDKHELLLIDLAQQLQQIVERQLESADLSHVSLDKVEWILLAERYADEFASVDDKELARRLKRYQKGK